MASRVHTAPAASCNASSQCCGPKASMQQLDRRPSGFGPLLQPARKLTPVLKPPPERVVERRKSLPKVMAERGRETSPQAVYDKLQDGCDGCRTFSAGELNIDPESDHMKKIPKCSRDKESLLEECLDLKNAMADQAYHLKLHKVHHQSVSLDNRKMESAIEELESSNGLEAPRTGGASRLKAKLQGLKARQEEYHGTLESQRDDLIALKKDPRIAFTHEAEVERDVFATETGRLQKIVRRLRVLYHRICAENTEIARLRDKIASLASKIKEIKLKNQGYKDALEKMKKDIQKEKDAAEQSKRDAKAASKKLKELNDHSGVLKDMLGREKAEANRLEKWVRYLEEDTRKFDKEAEDRKKQDALAKARALAKQSKKAGKKGRKGKVKKAKADKSDDASSLAESASTSAAGSAGSSGSAGSPGSAGSGSGGAGRDEEIDHDLMAAQRLFLGEVTTATERFIDDAPCSRPNSPKNKSRAGSPGGNDGQHSDFEKSRGSFMGKVETAEEKFLAQMEVLEYGKAGGGSKRADNKGGLTADAQAKISAAEQAKTKAEAEAKRLAEEARKAQEEARRLAAELEAMRRAAGGSGGKRWQKEKMIVSIDNKELKEGEYTSEVLDRGSEIAIKVSIKSPTGSDAKKRADEEAKRKADEDARRKKADADEAARQKKAEEDEAKRRKAEEDEAKRRQAEFNEQKKKMAADLDEQKKKMAADLAAAQKKAADEEAKRKAAEGKGGAGGGGGASSSGESGQFFDTQTQNVIKENIQEVLEHLENISETVQQKASASGTAESTAKDILKKMD